MKVSTRFSDSIHILAFICIYQGKITLSSTNIAGSLETSPVVVRRLMTSLKEAGFIKTKHGTPDPELLVDPQKSRFWMSIWQPRDRRRFLPLITIPIRSASWAAIFNQHWKTIIVMLKQPPRPNCSRSRCKTLLIRFWLSRQKRRSNHEIYHYRSYWASRPQSR